MKVMLLKSDRYLGEVGDVVNVKDGYAWNYLIPNKVAVSYNSGERIQLESQIQKIAEKEAKETSALQASLKELTDQNIVFVRETHDDGKLYGNIQEADVISEIDLSGTDIKLSKSMIQMDTINRVGEYSVELKLSRNVFGDITIEVKSENQSDEDIAGNTVTAVEAIQGEAPQGEANSSEETDSEES